MLECLWSIIALLSVWNTIESVPLFALEATLEATLDVSFSFNKNIYFAGQITGVEGYVESISSGMVSALNAVAQIKNESRVEFSNLTMIGALAKYISTANDKFQPMNANFGIVPELPKRIKDKKIKYGMLADRAIENLKIY